MPKQRASWTAWHATTTRTLQRKIHTTEPARLRATRCTNRWTSQSPREWGRRTDPREVRTLAALSTKFRRTRHEAPLAPTRPILLTPHPRAEQRECRSSHNSMKSRLGGMRRPHTIKSTALRALQHSKAPSITRLARSRSSCCQTLLQTSRLRAYRTRSRTQAKSKAKASIARAGNRRDLSTLLLRSSA